VPLPPLGSKRDLTSFLKFKVRSIWENSLPEHYYKWHMKGIRNSFFPKIVEAIKAKDEDTAAELNHQMHFELSEFSDPLWSHRSYKLIGKARDFDLDLPDLDTDNRDVWEGQFALHLTNDVYDDLHKKVKVARKAWRKRSRNGWCSGSR
jgi:hypothetical protein